MPGVNNDSNQQIWTSNGGTANIYGKVFGSGAFYSLFDDSSATLDDYNDHSFSSNIDNIFSVPIMAGFLGKAYLKLL